MAVGTLHAEIYPSASHLGTTALESSFSPTAVVQSVAAGFYGATALLAIQCVMALRNERNEQGEQFKRVLLCFVALLFSVNTAFFALCQERVHLDLSTVGSGRDAQVRVTVTTNYDYMHPIAGPLCGVLVIWISDSLLMYRCYQFYDKNLKILIGPIIMFFVSIVSSGLMVGPFIVQPEPEAKAHDDLSFPSLDSKALGTLGPFLPSIVNTTFSMSLNALLTAMIVKRLLRHNHELRTLFNDNIVANGVPYMSITAMLVESSGLVVLASLAYILFQFIFTRVNLYFIVVYSQVIATFLLILRVAKRHTTPPTKVYTRSTVPEIPSIALPLPVATYSLVSLSDRHSRASMSVPISYNSGITYMRTRRGSWPLSGVH